MNLHPVNPQLPVFVAICKHCGKRGESTALLADLDGEPFRAYYHGYCVNACPSCGKVHPNGFVHHFGTVAGKRNCRYCNAAI